MSKIKVVLKKDVKGIGKAKEVVEVSAGYAQNYLFRNSLAASFNDSEKAKLSKEKKDKDLRKEREKKEAEEIAKEIKKFKYSVKVKAKDGKIFGSICHQKISDLVKEVSGIKIDKKKVLTESLKTLGLHEVEIKLHHDVKAKIGVMVEGL